MPWHSAQAGRNGDVGRILWDPAALRRERIHVYVRSEYIDVAEGRISQACNRTAVMRIPDLVPAFSHRLKLLMRDSG
jgi:hypothetical protein